MPPPIATVSQQDAQSNGVGRSLTRSQSLSTIYDDQAGPVLSHSDSALRVPSLSPPPPVICSYFCINAFLRRLGSFQTLLFLLCYLTLPIFKTSVIIFNYFFLIITIVVSVWKTSYFTLFIRSPSRRMLSAFALATIAHSLHVCFFLSHIYPWT